MKERFVYVHYNYRKNKQVSFLLYKLFKSNMFSCRGVVGGAFIRQEASWRSVRSFTVHVQVVLFYVSFFGRDPEAVLKRMIVGVI